MKLVSPEELGEQRHVALRVTGPAVGVTATADTKVLVLEDASLDDCSVRALARSQRDAVVNVPVEQELSSAMQLRVTVLEPLLRGEGRESDLLQAERHLIEVANSPCLLAVLNVTTKLPVDVDSQMG